MCLLLLALVKGLVQIQCDTFIIIRAIPTILCEALLPLMPKAGLMLITPTVLDLVYVELEFITTIIRSLLESTTNADD